MPEPPSILGVSPHSVAPASTFLHYVQPNLNHGLRIWWAFYWPTTLAATLLTIAANLGLRQIYENTNAPGSVIGPLMKYDAYFFT